MGRRSVAMALAALVPLESDSQWRDSAFPPGLVHDVGQLGILVQSGMSAFTKMA